MIQSLIKPYKGLTREIWYLSFITLVNRAGAMVIPFLSLYLNKHLHFTLDDVGWIMTAFGLGSAAGSFTGGKLTDKFGYLRVMVSSLILTGLVFFGLQFFTQFWHLAVGVFTLSLVADTYRPAIWVAMDAYSNENNRTRSVTLIRLAINLGFAVGPALGGLIIANIGYFELFWIDGATSIIAGVLLMYLIVQKKKKKGIIPEKQSAPTLSPYRDIPYLIFIISIAFMGIAFLQFNSTMPIYFNRELGMSEEQIGLLLALNGGLIFLLEMPLVHYLEKIKKPTLLITIYGVALFVLSFLVLNIAPIIFFPILSMIFLTLGEMISFPFSNTFAMQRAQKGKKGDYMALYTLTFSIGHIFGPNLGMHISKSFGFQVTWFVMAGIMTLSALILYFLKTKLMKNSKMNN
jgi:predicted MFS family arabinose efflux permease